MSAPWDATREVEMLLDSFHFCFFRRKAARTSLFLRTWIRKMNKPWGDKTLGHEHYIQLKMYWLYTVYHTMKAYKYKTIPSCLLPRFQNESKYGTFHMKMSLICIWMNLWVKLIFIWKVLHQDSFWNRGSHNVKGTRKWTGIPAKMSRGTPINTQWKLPSARSWATSQTDY